MRKHTRWGLSTHGHLKWLLPGWLGVLWLGYPPMVVGAWEGQAEAGLPAPPLQKCAKAQPLLHQVRIQVVLANAGTALRTQNDTWLTEMQGGGDYRAVLKGSHNHLFHPVSNLYSNITEQNHM